MYRASIFLCALLAFASLGACTQSTTYYGAPAHTLRGKRVLLLDASRLSPTSEALHRLVVERIEAGIAADPNIGEVVRWNPDTSSGPQSLRVRDAFTQFSNTLSLSGVSDPELAHRLYEGLNVDLLAVAQPAYLPCAVCEQGDRLWLVRQLVDAKSGRIVFRAHFDAAGPEDPAEQAELANDLAGSYLEALALALELRYHRSRFENLRHTPSN